MMASHCRFAGCSPLVSLDDFEDLKEPLTFVEVFGQFYIEAKRLRHTRSRHFILKVLAIPNGRSVATPTCDTGFEGGHDETYISIPPFSPVNE